MRANEANPDPNSGVVLGGAIALALLARERFGIGQAVYVNMLAANMYANADDALDYAGKRPRPVADDELHGTAPATASTAPPTAGCSSPSTATPSGAGRSTVLERRDLADDTRFATADDRAANDGDLVAELADTLGKRTAAEWEERFVAAGVAGVRADLASPGLFFAHDQQVLANDFTPLVHPHPLRPPPPLGTDRARRTAVPTSSARASSPASRPTSCWPRWATTPTPSPRSGPTRVVNSEPVAWL